MRSLGRETDFWKVDQASLGKEEALEHTLEGWLGV